MWQLGLTHRQWYDLPKWQQEEWLAFSYLRKKSVADFIENLKRPDPKTGTMTYPMAVQPVIPLLMVIKNWM